MRRIGMIAWALAVLSFVLLPLLCSAKGERELIAVLGAKVRHEIAKRGEMPDTPPNVQLRNLTRAAEAAKAEAEAATDERDDARFELYRLEQEFRSKTASLKEQLQERGDINDGLSRQVTALAEKIHATETTPASAAVNEPPSFGPMKLTLLSPATATAPRQGQLYATVFTGEDVYNKGWCINCGPLHDRWGDGTPRVKLNWSGAVAPGHQVYPAIRWRNGAGKWQQPTTQRGEYLQPKTLDELAEWIESTGPQVPQDIAASAVGGSISTGGRIRMLLAAWLEYLGPDAAITVRWDRTGLQSLSATKLMHGEMWTATMVAGKFGHVGISTTSTKMPAGIQDLGFTYKTLDSGKFRLDADPLDIGLPTQPPMRVVGGSQPAGVIDPVTLGWGVYSFASALYQMLNPQVDVGLGGCVEFVVKLDGDKLIVTFSECPSIHVSAWFRFDLDVQRVEITTSNVHVAFKPQPQNWIRIDSRDFAVKDD